MTKDYTPVIPKDQLVTGQYYRGKCRNATEARWDGSKFHYWRYKLGTWFVEDIRCPEDDSVYDVFIAVEPITEEQAAREIPLEAGNVETT